jgi:hypothetical protein
MNFLVGSRKLGSKAALLQLVGLALLTSPDNALTQDQVRDLAATPPAPTLVLGFVGGFVHSDDARHSEIQLARRLQEAYGETVHVRIFKNRDRVKAHKEIVKWLNSIPSTEPRPQPRVILFGHSWGASAVVYLARELEQDGVAVALTVQVDSISKHGQDDSIIPANVTEAVKLLPDERHASGPPEDHGGRSGPHCHTRKLPCRIRKATCRVPHLSLV